MKISKGIKLALMTAIISGVSIFVNKYGVKLVSPPLLYATLKNTFVGVLILSLLMGMKKFDEIKALSKDEWKKLLAIGIVGGSLPFYLFFEALSKTSAINAVMIHKTLFLWVALLAAPFLKEKLTKMQFGAVVMLYLSNLVVGSFSGFNLDRGEMMALAATMLWAVENVIAKKTLKTVSSEVVTFFRMGVGAVILWGITLYQGIPVTDKLSTLSTSQWSILLVVSAFLFAYVRTWYSALKVEKAVVVSSVLVGSTIVTNVLSSVFITHKLSGNVLIQLLLVVFGIGVFLREERKRGVRVISS